MTTTENNPAAIAVIGAAVVVVIVVAIVLAIRRREIAFEGEVIDKSIVENRTNNMPMNNMNPANNGGINIINSGGIQHEYYIKVKTAVGKTIKYKISSGMYEAVKIGDTVSKPKGTTEITITSSKSPSTTPTENSTPQTPTL